MKPKGLICLKLHPPCGALPRSLSLRYAGAGGNTMIRTATALAAAADKRRCISMRITALIFGLSLPGCAGNQQALVASGGERASLPEPDEQGAPLDGAPPAGGLEPFRF